MSNTISQRIMAITLAPSLLIFGLSAASIICAASLFPEILTGIEPKGALNPLFVMVAGIPVITLVSALFIAAYVKRKISGPLQALILAADSVSTGNWEAEIPHFPGSKDEIGSLSASLQRMAEQLRVYILRLEQTREEEIIYSKADAFMTSRNLSEGMGELLALLCECLGADKAIAVRLSDGSARVFSRHERGASDSGAEPPRDFLYHTQVMTMLAGKNILIMNSYIISGQATDFLDKETRFACILPLRDDNRVPGYIIFESKRKKNPFGAKAESILYNIADALSDFVKRDEKEPELPDPVATEPEGENPAPRTLEAVRDVEGLDCSAAIQAMGGMSELYEQALKLLTGLLPETIEKLDSCIASDMDSFAIEIHGLKGSLNNVGAYDMGGEALRVERAAKSGDYSLCAELYASFKDSLRSFHRRLIAAFEAACGKLPGNVLKLVAILPEAERMAASGDCGAALNLLRPLDDYSFDRESDALLGESIAALESSDAEKALEGILELRERLSGWEDA